MSMCGAFGAGVLATSLETLARMSKRSESSHFGAPTSTSGSLGLRSQAKVMRNLRWVP